MNNYTYVPKPVTDAPEINAAILYIAAAIFVVLLSILMGLIVSVFNISKESTRIRKLIEAKINHDVKSADYKIGLEK